MPYDPIVFKELLFHIDNLFHTRVNFFLAVQALLFAGVASVWGTESVRLGVGLFGVLFTVLFFLANWNLSYSLQWLMHTFETVEPTGMYRDFKAQKVLPRSLPTIVIFTYVLPGVSLLGWVSVLCSLT